MFEQEDIDALNNEIAAWNKNDKQEILNEMDALGIKHSRYSQSEMPLRKALKDRLGKSSGLINRISYSFPRSAIFLHKGVSRGHPYTNPRKAKKWFNPVIEKNLPDLADIVANGQGNLIVNALKIK